MAAAVPDPFEFAANLIDPQRDDGWDPLPHQVQPPGKWFIWMLLGGRGAGKTAAMAKAMDDHVKGPPCLPGIPGGHWPSIIAPTLGDAVTSCVNGPSGLRKWEPNIRVRVTPGGTVARWPNGTEAKLFGASSPEDVERLRSGGNRCLVWCIAEGTPVLTDKGWIPIEKIIPGVHKAWTDEGWSPISEKERTNSSAETMEIRLSNGRTLRCTPDHRIFMASGETRNAIELTLGDKLAACSTHALTEQESLGEMTSNWMVSPSSLTNMGTTDLTGSSCTDTSGRKPTEGQLKRFITRTSSVLTTAFRIFRHLPRQSIQPYTTSSEKQETGRWLKDPVSSATRSSSQKDQMWRQARTTQDSALAFAGTKGQLQPDSLGASGRTHVRDAERQHRTSTSVPEHATTHQGSKTTEIVKVAETTYPASESVSVVGIVTTNGTKSAVWDITVPGPSHFYANGVKVHNCEELAAWRYMSECWQHMRYGLRVGPWPHVLVSTTPKALRMIKDLVKRAIEDKDKKDSYIIISTATTADNPHLDQRVKDDLYADYGGTRLGRQELLAEILEDVEGALWTPEDIELWRIRISEQPPRYSRIAVAVDPQAKEGGDDTGIVVAAMLPNLTMWRRAPANWNFRDRHHFFVLADYSVNGKPDVWGRRVVEALNDFDAHVVVAEINNGGEMVEHTIHTVDDTIPVKTVHATRGKERRAEPVSALYQQGRGHHVGMHPKLEDQMVSWDAVEPDPSWSPDHMDAMVWAATELVVGHQQAKQFASIDRRLAGRR